MAKKDKDLAEPKKGDRFTFARSRTVVEVTKVHDNGLVDVQEPGNGRFWADVDPATQLDPITE